MFTNIVSTESHEEEACVQLGENLVILKSDFKTYLKIGRTFQQYESLNTLEFRQLINIYIN